MWFKMHSVDLIPEEQPEQIPEPVKQKDKVRAHGRGKSRFIDVEMKDEREVVTEPEQAQVEPEVILETKPAVPELVM